MISRKKRACSVHCVVLLPQQRLDKGTPLTISPALYGAAGQLFCVRCDEGSAVQYGPKLPCRPLTPMGAQKVQ